MLDLSIVREKYLSMSDDELILFATNEAVDLTPEAFQLLREEFIKRSLDLTVLESSEIDAELSNLQKQTTLEKVTSFEFAKAMWQFALDEKATGKSDSEIYELLRRRNISEEYAYAIIISLEQKAKEMIEKCDTQVIASSVSIAGGLLCFYLLLAGYVSQLFFLFALSLTVFGCIRLFKAYKLKDKFTKISKQIQLERDTEDKIYKNAFMNNNLN